jgi:hypothetical protein
MWSRKFLNLLLCSKNDISMNTSPGVPVHSCLLLIRQRLQSVVLRQILWDQNVKFQRTMFRFKLIDQNSLVIQYLQNSKISHWKVNLESRYSDWLRPGRRRGQISSLGSVKNFFLQVVQTGSGTHPTSYSIGTGGSFPGLKRPVREADHLQIVPRSKRCGSVHLLTHTPSWCSA